MDVFQVAGSVSIRERIAVGDGVLTVKVVDRKGEVLAAGASVGSGVPREFALDIDPSLLENSDHLLVWAMLRTETGTWGTLDLAPVGDDIILNRIDA